MNRVDSRAIVNALAAGLQSGYAANAATETERGKAMNRVEFGEVTPVNNDFIAPDWPHIRRHRERKEMRVFIDGVDAGVVREDNGGRLECDINLSKHFEFGLGADSIGRPENFPAAKQLIRSAVEKTA